jgi:beta-lactam-binding protein with PASTA domain
MSGKGSRLWAELASNGKETATCLPTEEPAPSAAPTAIASPVATATLVPTATALPTAVSPTQIPDVMIPDLHDLSEKEAQDRLKKLGLQARNVDKCTDSDQGELKGKKHSVQCQNPAANTTAPIGTPVEYVVRQ